MTDIFNKLGGVTVFGRPDNADDFSYITLVGVNDKRDKDNTPTAAFKTVLSGRAPASNITIEEKVDYTIDKSLVGDLLVSAFGYTPVTITITGLDIFRDTKTKCTGDLASSGDTIKLFFDKYNVYKNSKARIKVGMAAANAKGVGYTCVLLELHRETTAVTVSGDGSLPPGVGRYKLTLLGVRNS